MAENEILKIDDITQKFGGLTALSHICIDIHPGEILGVIGPNGAGKTTLFNLITGIYRPSEGKILLNGQDITGKKPYQIAELGISRTFQNIRLFRKMTVLENVMAGRHIRTKSNLIDAVFKTARRRREEREGEERALEILKFMGLDSLRYHLAESLPYGAQRKLEIARALATSPKLLLLDEPAAGMNPNETQELMDTIRFVRDTFEMTILLIEHDMRLVSGICEELTVLNFGMVLAQGETSQVLNNPEVVKAYLGE